VRHAEDQVIVTRRQQFPLPGCQPPVARVGLALRTVAVPAGNGALTITCIMGSNSLWRV
jgi:hypothetical protein